MPLIRSILWVGPSAGFADSGVLDTATLDVTWMRDTSEVDALPACGFDAAVVSLPSLAAAGDAVDRLATRAPGLPIVAITPAMGEDAAQGLQRRGAHRVLQSVVPHERSTLARLTTILDDLDGQAARPGARSRQGLPPGVVGSSPAMMQVYALVERAASSRATVLMRGETGTGKEVIARAIHQSGERRAAFVAVNCAAFPDTLLESELFGHVKGAFTGADRTRPGLFEVADRGTLFLDEIGETSAPLQAKLLRVLQEREVRPIGGERTRPVDVRVVAASNRDLRDAATRGLFREDLYYRLAVFPITLPPLRERAQDILPLAAHFLAEHGRRDGKPGCGLSKAASHLLLAHTWPGNVRELENEMQRALALAEPGQIITPALLSEGVIGIVEAIECNTHSGDTLRDSLDRIEAWLIRRSLESHGGRKAATARRLGITREGLYKKMKRLGIE